MATAKSFATALVRANLYEAAHIILTKPLKGCRALKSWAMRLARRAGTKKAKVALARKLAVSCIACSSMASASVMLPRGPEPWR
ncbi:MAG: hypothetical protein JO283_09850 [Bradyrhizobium sp.]|nr:hypothetical protein [Bradyrhizobium sp.]